MMQTAEPRRRDSSPARIRVLRRLAICRRSLLQPEVRSVVVVVTDVLAHQAFQVALVENDDMVE